MVYKPIQYKRRELKIVEEGQSEIKPQEKLLPPSAEIYTSSLKKFRAMNAGQILDYYNTTGAENLFSVEYAVIQQVLLEKALCFSNKKNELEALLEIANKILDQKKAKIN